MTGVLLLQWLHRAVLRLVPFCSSRVSLPLEQYILELVNILFNNILLNNMLVYTCVGGVCEYVQ